MFLKPLLLIDILIENECHRSIVALKNKRCFFFFLNSVGQPRATHTTYPHSFASPTAPSGGCCPDWGVITCLYCCDARSRSRSTATAAAATSPAACCSKNGCLPQHILRSICHMKGTKIGRLEGTFHVTAAVGIPGS